MKKDFGGSLFKILQMLGFLIHLNNEHSDQNLLLFDKGVVLEDIYRQELVVSKLHSNFFPLSTISLFVFDLIVV